MLHFPRHAGVFNQHMTTIRVMTSFIPNIISGLTSGAFAVALLIFIFRNHVKSYLNQKGKNLADKEDIAQLTAAVEAVKSDYAQQLREVTHKFDLMLEDRKSSNQLKMAALDKRLEAHQQAFALWRKLFGSVHSSNIADVVIECQTWWENNCLYLEEEPRNAFSDAMFRAPLHGSLLQGARHGGVDSETIQDNWRVISAAGGIIAKAVALPGLTTSEVKEIDSKPPAPMETRSSK